MLSVSMLPGYEYCKRKLFLNYVLKIREPFKKSTSLGTLRHETYERINNAEEKLVKSIRQDHKKEDIHELFKKRYQEILINVIKNNKKPLLELELNLGVIFRKVLPLILEESEERVERLFKFIQENNFYGEELWENLTPKTISELRIDSEKLNLKGYIDQIEIHKNRVVPIELKTGSCPQEGVWPGHRLQVGAYAMLAEEHFNQEVKEAFILYLDQKQKRHISINPFLKEEIKEMIKKIELLLLQKTPPNKVSNLNKCLHCGIKKECNNEDFLKTELNKKQKI